MVRSCSLVRRFATGAATAAAVLVASTASASPESDARELFTQGRELRARSDCGHAAPLFLRAWSTYPQALGPLRNFAECEELLGHVTSARRAWLELRAAASASPADRYAGWDEDAERAAARLDPKIARFVIASAVRTRGAGARAAGAHVTVFVDGEPLDASAVGTVLERDPGTYRLRAEAPAAAPVEQEVTLVAGENPPVTLELELAPPPPRRVEAAVPSDGPPSAASTAGWIVAGAGAVALVTAVFTFRARQEALNELDAECPTHRGCSKSLRDTVERGDAMGTATSILVPVGAVGLVAGFALVLTTGRAPEPSRTVRSVRLAPSLGALRLSGEF